MNTAFGVTCQPSSQTGMDTPQFVFGDCHKIEILHVLLLFLHRTFLRCPCCFRFAVHALKLVEKRPDFNLIHNALFKVWEDNTALRRDLYIQGQPWAWWRKPWCLPVQNSVTLDELGLSIDLREWMKILINTQSAIWPCTYIIYIDIILLFSGLP